MPQSQPERLAKFRENRPNAPEPAPFAAVCARLTGGAAGAPLVVNKKRVCHNAALSPPG